MIRNFKTLGLALVAVLAMSAVVASAASAQFTASSYPASATATSALGNDKFQTEAGTVECAGHFAVGPLAEPSSTVTVTPTYTSCKAFGFSATVHMNGCDYDFHDNGEVDVVCPGEAKIAITAGPCEAQVGPQTGLSSVTLGNVGNHVSAQADVGGIAYSATKDGFLCPFNGTGAKTNATYKQGSAVTVAPTGGVTSISVD